MVRPKSKPLISLILLSGHYICGVSPTLVSFCACILQSHLNPLVYFKEEEPDMSSLDIDYDYFQHKVWPAIAYRVPAFNCLKVIINNVYPKVII